MTLWQKILNGIFILVFIASIGVFLFTEFKTSGPLTNLPKEVLMEPKEIDWTPLIPGLTSITLFLLKYYLLDKKKNKTDNRKPKSLLDHQIFSDIEELKFNSIKNINVGSEGRSEMFKTMLEEMLNVYDRQLTQFLISNSSFESGSDYRKKCRALIFNIIAECEQNWLKLGIPQPVITKYLSLHNERIKMLLSDIDTSSYIFPTFNESLVYILYEIRTALRLSFMKDSLQTSVRLNGELDNLTFNGKKL